MEVTEPMEGPGEMPEPDVQAWEDAAAALADFRDAGGSAEAVILALQRATLMVAVNAVVGLADNIRKERADA